MTQHQRLENYNAQIEDLGDQERYLSKYSTRLSASRLVIFILVITLVIYTASINGLLAAVLGIIGLTLFLWVVRYHHKKDR